MAKWWFKTAARHTRYSCTHHWYWQLDTDHSLLTSIKLFGTLDECVADAQANGFRGTLYMPEYLTFPAVLTWEEGAPLVYRRPAATGQSAQQAA